MAIKHLPDKEDLINCLWKSCVIQLMFKKNIPELIISIQESVQKNKWMTLLDSLITSSLKNLNMLSIHLYQILVQELILKEKDFKPYWTVAYKKMSEKLLLPTKIDFPDLDLNYYNCLLKNQEEQSQCLMKKNIKALNKNCQKIYYQLSTSTVVNKWVEENTKQIVTRCLKIKIKPNNESKNIFKEFFYTSNYVYNKTVYHINNRLRKVNFQNLRDEFVTSSTKKCNSNYEIYMNRLKELNKQLKDDIIKDDLINQIKITKNDLKNIKFEKNKSVNEWELNTPKEIRAGAVNDVCKAFKTCSTNLNNGNIKFFRLGYRTKNNFKKCILIPKTFIKNVNGKIKIAPSYINEEFTMGKRNFKKYKDLVINHDCRLTLEHNEYILHIPIDITVKDDKKCDNYIGVDPGVSEFLTTFGNKDINEINYNKTLLKKLKDKIDLLRIKRKHISKKKLSKLDKQKENMINELHYKSISELIKNDYIFFGDIKSHDIVKKSNKHRLNRITNDLCFYKFKTRLKEQAEKFNKKVYFINERYTTKTCSCCGNVQEMSLSQRIYECNNCYIKIPRDINSAKNILMRGIIEHL